MDTIFIEGMSFKKPREGAPDFIKGNISVDVKKFFQFAKNNHKNGWLNIDLKRAREGKLYLALNTYQKEAKPELDEWDTMNAELAGNQ